MVPLGSKTSGFIAEEVYHKPIINQFFSSGTSGSDPEVYQTRPTGTVLVGKRSSFLKVLSGICGNLSAAWFGIILVAPGLSLFENPNYLAVLTRCLILGILFLL